MKTMIILFAMVLISLASIAQSKTQSASSQPSPKEKEQTPVQPDTAVLVISRKDAAEYIKAMQTGYGQVSTSETISSRQGSQAESVYAFILSVIFKKFPDLVPKQK